MARYDAIIIGGGIGGAGIGAALAPHLTVLVLEQEPSPGYHTTGRSAAFYAESYGGPLVQPLTSLSGAFLKSPPPGFGDNPFVTRRGALHIFSRDQRSEADIMLSELEGVSDVALLDADRVRGMASDVRWPDLAGAVNDPDCGDLDVASIHHAYLAAVKRNGGVVLCGHELVSAERQAGNWRVQTNKGDFQSDLIINAAGAWADVVAERCGVSTVGLRPLRRTAVTLPKLVGSEVRHDSPVVLNIEETCYFRPEGEGYLVSPADETPSAPCDAQAEEMDIAVALDRFQTYTGLEPRRIASKWAGLRTFAPDRAPVIGADPAAARFYWSAGQGGWGIQTSPAWSALLANQIAGQQDLIAGDIASIDPMPFSPARFRAG